MRYLLDTNIVSDLVPNPGGRITQRIREVGESYSQFWCIADLNQAAFLRISLSSMPSTNFTLATRSAS